MSATAVLEDEATSFPALLGQIRAAGLMERRSRYYTVKVLATVAAFAVGWAGLWAVGDSWWTLLVAAFLGLASAQVVFLGHDAGHRQISSSRRANRLIGLAVGNLGTGLSFGWWVPKHGAHHAHPNTEDRDPDIANGVIAFTSGHAGDRTRASRWIVRHQAGLFFPLTCLEAASMHVASVRSLWQRRSEPPAATEGLLLVFHLVAYLTVVAWVLSPARAVVFVAVQQGVLGFYLGCSFAPNHKGMPVLAEDDDLSYAERQILTARNVDGGKLVTFLLGGLDYQIEHHLFPTMPRPNLPRAQPYVRAFCAASGLPYHQTGLIDSYRRALRHLHEIGSTTG